MADTRVPADLLYTTQHEWVRVEGANATFGITDFAQHALGEVTYVELPEVGAPLAQGKEFAVVESLKAASDVYAPIGGKVTAVNSALADTPNTVNADPYGQGWLCKLQGVDKAQLPKLLSPKQYEELLSKEEG